ncbi:MAG: tyrosine-type recombinase/integrase [Chlamydiales bacterium]
MTLMPTMIESPIFSALETYEQAKAFQTNLVWKKLDEITVEEAISYWLTTLSLKTQINYRSGIRKLVELGLLNPLMSLQAFALTNHEVIIDRIKLIQEWAESSRQARAACYISFTGFLSRRLQGVVKKALPNKEGSSKTFFRIGEKVKTSAMTQAQWIAFFKELEKINPRDALIGKVILQGGKRVNEVLSLQTHQIDWGRCEITFPQSKMRGIYKETVITYSESIMKRLREYIEDRAGHVFITRFGKPVMINQVAVTFAKAGNTAGIPFKVSPHVLRASAVTYLKQQGFQDSDIMRVTGHANSEMVYAYDKSDRADNASKKVNLIS